MVIEFHDVHLNLDSITNFIDSVNLKLIHIHPNNTINYKNSIPPVLELSFEREPIVVGEDVKFPHYLDQKNDKRNNDLKLTFSNAR